MRESRLLVIVGVTLSACGGTAGVDGTGQAIVGGRVTAGHPAVGYVSSEYAGYASGCTGTLVGDRWFLTAAHCLEEDRSGAIQRVRVTFEADAGRATTWHTARRWARHPSYGKPAPGDSQYYINRGYDCALVELDAPVGGVAPIPYGRFAMDASHVGRAVTQVGYGFINGQAQGSGQKRELQTTIGEVYDGVLGLAQNGTGTCQGDSGGPTLLVEGGLTQVVGVSSYGSHGCPGGGWMSRTHLCAAWLDGQVGAGGGTCVPSCGGRACGGDGCGGSCGACATGEQCSAAGACEPAPVASCGDETEPNERQSNANVFCPDGTLRGTLASASDTDVIRADIAAGATYDFRLDGLGASAGMTLWKVQGDGSLARIGDAGAAGSTAPASIRRYTPTGGRYFLQVWGFTGYTAAGTSWRVSLVLQ